MHEAISDELVQRMKIFNSGGELQKLLKITTTPHNSNSVHVSENITNISGRITNKMCGNKI